MKLTELKGIGEKTAGAFARLGIFSAEDLTEYYPRDFEKFEEPKPIYSLEPGKTGAVRAVLTSNATVNRFNGMVIVNVIISDMTGKLQLSWFNSLFLRSTLTAGSEFVFRGRVYEKNGRLIMNQPKIYKPDDYDVKYKGRLMPVYSLTKGITNKTVMNAAAEALKKVNPHEEYLPADIIEKYGLPNEPDTVIRMHFPRDEKELLAVRRRIVFNEFFMFMLAGSIFNKAIRESKSDYKCKPDFRMIKFIADLPFELTAAQMKTYREISADLSSGRVMNRLIEGDVGSGKTILAVLSMLFVCLNGFQAAMMAPTVVLAQQHYENIKRLVENSGLNINVTLLTGSMPQAERRSILEDIKEHRADIIIGTHALFSEDVNYDRLALVVTDEQHRFGVGQREQFTEKGKMPHNLIMSATPIPRTLALMLYSGLDMSVIDVLPEGRLPIKNCVVGPSYRNTAYKFIKDEVKKGHQIYIICPSIEAGDEEESGLENVMDYAEKLKAVFGEEIKISVLHGQMKDKEKESIMDAFKRGESDVLISTTVIEVGVDVPNATVMMIENAERFGLATLHQLRGRVGRGKAQSYCIMINTSDSEKAAERLDILNHSNDGFHIAEEDLRLRGPGDIFGIRQSGELNFKTADIYADRDILKSAKEAAESVLKNDPDLNKNEHKLLKSKLDKYMKNGYTV